MKRRILDMLMWRVGRIFFVAGILMSISMIANSNEKTQSAITFLRSACVSDQIIDIEIEGSGGLSFLKRGIEGSTRFSRKELNGFLKGLANEITAEQDDKIRKCMEPYIPRILDIILGLSGDESSVTRHRG